MRSTCLHCVKYFTAVYITDIYSTGLIRFLCDAFKADLSVTLLRVNFEHRETLCFGYKFGTLLHSFVSVKLISAQIEPFQELIIAKYLDYLADLIATHEIIIQ